MLGHALTEDPDFCESPFVAFILTSEGFTLVCQVPQGALLGYQSFIATKFNSAYCFPPSLVPSQVTEVCKTIILHIAIMTVIHSPSLEMFKDRLDGAGSKLV